MPPRAPRGTTALRLDTPVKFLKGIGERRAELLERLGIRTAQDLLWHLPHRYIDASTVTPLVKAEVGQEVACIGRVVAKGVVPTRRGLRIFHAVLRDDSGVLECVWPGQAFLDRTIVVGQTLLVSGPVRFYHGRQMAPREFVILADADSEPEPLAGGKVLPVYPATEGLSHKVIRGLVDRHLDTLIAASQDVLPDAIRRSLDLPPLQDALRPRSRRSSAGGASRSTSCSTCSSCSSGPARWPSEVAAAWPLPSVAISRPSCVRRCLGSSPRTSSGLCGKSPQT
jgi:ATP-dependent DNA helicase RecG